MTNSLNNKKYRIRTALFMGGYTALSLATITGAFEHLKPSGAWAFALVAAAPVAGQIWAILAWMRDSDEFVRALNAKRFIVATGITLALASAWGFMELYAGAPHVSSLMVFPLLCASWGIVTPFIQTTR
jgi:putative oxidoreductase